MLYHLKLFIKDPIDKTGLLIYLIKIDYRRLSEKFDELIEKYEGFSKKKNMITYKVTVGRSEYTDRILNNFDNLSNVIDRINYLVRYNVRYYPGQGSLEKPSSVKVKYKEEEEEKEEEISKEDYGEKDIKDISFEIEYETGVG